VRPEKDVPNMRGLVLLAVLSVLSGATLTAAQAETAVPAEAAGVAEAAALADALDITGLLAVMHQEGIAYGAELEDGMFPGRGGASWPAAVERIYGNPSWADEFRQAFAAALDDRAADKTAILAFLTSDVGRRAVGLEISARRALLDEAVEEASKLKLAELRDAKDARLAAIREFVSVNDLIDANVMGGLNANLAFYKGLNAAGAFETAMSEAEILEDVWSQEPALRAETEDWLLSFLVLAYAPLSDADLADYTAFSRTEPGQDLNAALFAGFDRVFVKISAALGSAAAVFAAGEDL
jgi:Uncharacterized protein conserved in bacteria (DUF2059)